MILELEALDFMISVPLDLELPYPIRTTWRRARPPDPVYRQIKAHDLRKRIPATMLIKPVS